LLLVLLSVLLSKKRRKKERRKKKKRKKRNGLPVIFSVRHFSCDSPLVASILVLAPNWTGTVKKSCSHRFFLSALVVVMGFSLIF
jgi:cytochrome c biogenesis protein CcdA